MRFMKLFQVSQEVNQVFVFYLQSVRQRGSGGVQQGGNDNDNFTGV